MDSVRAQRTECLFDLVVVDDTDFPSPQYVEWLRGWARSQPLGRASRVRLKRFGWDHDGTMFTSPVWKIGYARRLLWGWFERWRSYDALLSLDCNVLMPPDALQTLHDAALPWAASWLPGCAAPPSDEPFPLDTTHLSCTLVRREVVERVTFRLATASDVQFSQDSIAAGFQPHCVPRVRCCYATEQIRPSTKEAVI